MKTVQELEEVLAKPSEALIREISEVDGDIMLLGVGGKMGPSMARLTMNAIKAAGVSKRVYGDSRFSNAALKAEPEDAGLEIIAADLSNDAELLALPDVKNVIYVMVPDERWTHKGGRMVSA